MTDVSRIPYPVSRCTEADTDRDAFGRTGQDGFPAPDRDVTETQQHVTAARSGYGLRATEYPTAEGGAR